MPDEAVVEKDAPEPGKPTEDEESGPAAEAHGLIIVLNPVLWHAVPRPPSRCKLPQERSVTPHHRRARGLPCGENTGTKNVSRNSTGLLKGQQQRRDHIAETIWPEGLDYQDEGHALGYERYTSLIPGEPELYWQAARAGSGKTSLGGAAGSEDRLEN